ncbi:MAG: MarR family transcriptional regulator [Pseudorhodoplanes sp.]
MTDSQPNAGQAAPKAARRARRDIDLDELTQHLGYFLRRAQVWVFQDFIRTLSAIEIRPAQYSVLIVIGANPGLSQAELADKLAIERARLVHMLDQLEKRDFIERLPSPVDRRTHALRLTREGQKILKRAKALAAKHEARLAEKLGADAHRELLRVLAAFGSDR